MVYPHFQDNSNWVPAAFMVKLGADDFQSIKQILQYTLRDERYAGMADIPTTDPMMHPVIATTLAAPAKDEPDVKGATSPNPMFMTRRRARDTSIGGNDAVNCFNSFNRLDDPVVPFTRAALDGSGERERGLGRVWGSMYEDTAQILYISCGVPIFNNVAGFYTDAVSSALANVMNKGEDSDGVFAQAVGAVVVYAFLLPVMPLIWLNKKLGGLMRTPISKYYDFREKMELYYQSVNGILRHLSVNMGLGVEGRFQEQLESSGNGSTQTGSETTYKSHAEIANDTLREYGQNGNNLPDNMKRWGIDIRRMLHQKSLYEGIIRSTDDVRWSDAVFAEAIKKDPMDNVIEYDVTDKKAAEEAKVDPQKATYVDKFVSSLSASLHDATRYIGFRIGNEVDASESFSNSTGESEIAQKLNSSMQSARQIQFSTMMGQVAEGALGQMAEGIAKAGTDFFKGAANALGMGSVAQVMTGTAMVDIPEMWTGSSFSRSYNFTLPLRAVGGEPESIMQDIYIPLALILAASAPRSAGKNSYVSPYLIRASCRGMFSVAAGMIDSVSIKRGSDVNGWNYQRLPTSVDISFSIKDLSPVLFIPLPPTGLTGVMESVLTAAFGTESAFQEYLMTLSGVGLAERITFAGNLLRRRRELAAILHRDILSPYAHASFIASTAPMQMLSAVVPATHLPRN